MTMEERGVYVTALSMCWIEDGLDIGSRVVQGWFNQYPAVARCFIEKDGKFRNPRLDEERRKQVLWHDKSSKGGKKSAEIKRLSKGGSRVVQPSVNQRSTLPSSLSPLPSSKREEHSRECSSERKGNDSEPNASERKRTPSMNRNTWEWENISPSDISAWKEAYPACDISLELARMREWIKSNPAKGHKSNWRAFITRWLTRSQDRGGSANGVKPAESSDDYIARMQAMVKKGSK